MGTLNNLDPPNGDYVKYIEDIQKGKIVPVDGLPVPAESVHHHPMVDSNTTAPTAAAATRTRSFDKAVMLRLLGFLVAIAGVSFIATGILIGPDDLIPLGMFTTFASFILIQQKRRK